MTQLRCFIAVARERNFTRAAKACHMTQPSLSYQIGRLEEELGEALFIRKPKAVELSDSGKLLLESALRIVEEQEAVVSKFRMREQLLSGEVRLGIIPTMAPYLLPPLLQAFRQSYPKISLVVRESRTSQLVKEVVSGEIEFAIVSDVEASSLKKYSLHLARLFEEALLLAVPNAHPLCGVTDLSVRHLQDQELILLSEGNCLRDQTEQLCSRRGDENALVCEQLPTQLSLVAAGLGVAVVPEMAVRESRGSDLEYLSFSGQPPRRMIGFLKKRGGKLSLAAQEFVIRLRRRVDGVV
ncbi:LysR substrate-binding domain-containing protein [Pelagicoccus sp. SDUM812003]|uniref:LysR family transcriptional regulator n=1 Tax=Pelagicoccus sp. SDUM812003 TaxID=3041267 RepID=UPI0028109460|nr:LysR substrate-binding domain-containing protein [Pelagicoccus sp. SDUM812003]MDQ8202681.1 LysR substrate-binding domain-containing protein [Pelagicoccus sp. SDUM812003]